MQATSLVSRPTFRFPLRTLAGFATLAVAIATSLTLGSCGKSTQTMNPDVSVNDSAKLPATPTGGQPSAKFAFSTSDLDLIKTTSGTSGWVTILSAPIKMPAAKELFVSASLEAGLFTQTLARSKNNKKDTSTASVAIQATPSGSARRASRVIEGPPWRAACAARTYRSQSSPCAVRSRTWQRR